MTENTRITWKSRRSYLIAMLLVGSIVLAACSSSTSTPSSNGASSNGANSQKAVNITIGWQPDPDAPLYIAREEGLFKKNGLNASYSTFESAPPMFSALKAGAVDVADMGAIPYSIGLSQGLNIKALMVGMNVSPTNAFVARAGINSITQLRGKSVGVTVGASTYLLLQQLLANAHMTMADIHVVNMQVPNMIPAWEHGDIAAAFAWSPWIYELPGGHIVTNMQEHNLPVPQYWAANGSFVKNNPVAASRFVKTISEAISILHAHPKLAVSAMASQLSVSSGLAKTLLNANIYPTRSEQLSSNYALSMVGAAQGKGAAGSTQRIADLLLTDGFIKSRPDIGTSFDASFLKK